jgi:hypothetical protein
MMLLLEAAKTLGDGRDLVLGGLLLLFLLVLPRGLASIRMRRPA